MSGCMCCLYPSQEEGPHNPKLNAFYYEETVLQSELDAVRDCCHETARFWKIVSSEARNAIGGPTGFKIQPSPKIAPFVPLDRAAHLKRAQFLNHQLWVTPFHPKERYPGYVSVNVSWNENKNRNRNGN